MATAVSIKDDGGDEYFLRDYTTREFVCQDGTWEFVNHTLEGIEDPERAAESFMAQVFSDWEYPEESDLIVVMDDGTEHKVTVTVESVPEFHATKKE